MLTKLSFIALHPHTLASLGGTLTIGAATAGLFNGWSGTDWVQFVGAIVGFLVSYFAGRAQGKK